MCINPSESPRLTASRERTGVACIMRCTLRRRRARMSPESGPGLAHGEGVRRQDLGLTMYQEMEAVAEKVLQHHLELLLGCSARDLRGYVIAVRRPKHPVWPPEVCEFYVVCTDKHCGERGA